MEYFETRRIFSLKYIDWQAELGEMLFLRPQGSKAYICSPLRDELPKNTYDNMLAARFYLYWMLKEHDKYAVAPHAYLPLLLDDTVPNERKLVLDFGLQLLLSCSEIHVCSRLISAGMEQEISCALRHGLPVYTYNADVQSQVNEMTDGMCSASRQFCRIGSAFGLSREDLKSWGITRNTYLATAP